MAEVDEASALVASVARGAGRVLLLEGEPGIGKTRLLDELFTQASAFRLQVLRSAADELERRRPFGAVAECLGIERTSSGPRAEIARLLYGTGSQGEVAPLEGAALEFRVARSMLLLVEELCARQPLAVAVEDLQWADPSTLLVLHRLGRAIVDLPLLLVCTFRPHPRPTALDELVDGLRAGGATHLILGPLDDEAATQLVRERVGATPGVTLRRQVARAGGNPLFVLELIEGLQREEAIEIGSGGRAEVRAADQRAVPPSVTSAIQRRLRYVPDEVLEVLRLASVLGSRFRVTDLSLVTGKAAAELADALRTAALAGILSDRPEALVFRHDLIREALYQQIPGAVRGALHLDVGRALAAAGAPPEQVAEHLARGAAPGDRQAVEWLVRAARDAAPRSPAVAVDLLERTLELLPPSDPARDELLADLAVGLMWSGRGAQARTTCREVLQREHDLAAEGRLRFCLVLATLAEGRGLEALEEAKAAIDSVAVTESDRARLRAWESHARMLTGDMDGAVETAEAAQAAAERLRDDLTWCIASACVAMVREFRGDFAGATELIDRAIRVADRTEGREGHRFQLHVMRGLFLMDLDRPAEAIETVQRGRRISEEIGASWNLPLYQIPLIAGHFLSGEWDDAIAEYESSIRLAEEIGTRHGMVFMTAVMSLLAFHRNELARAEALCAAAERELAETGPQHRSDWTMWARALLLEAVGNLPEALSTLRNAWSFCSAIGLHFEYPVLGPDLVRLAVALGEREEAAEACAAVEEVGAQAEIPWVRGAALRCRGLLEGNAEALVGAVEWYRKSPRPLERGMACEDAAAAVAATGDAALARDLFNEALGLYEQLDAARDVARAESRMRSAGLQRGRRGARKRPSMGWESLTQAQLKVVGLVVEGLSNPQIAERLFLSRLTVRTHLTHIFTKLGIASRAELAAAAARRAG